VLRALPLLAVPAAPLLAWAGGGTGMWVFIAGVAGIAVLADWIRRAAEQLALHTGAAIGGLLTVSLGSLAELLLALFILAQGQVAIVQAQITGSIMGTSLLGLGLAIVAGGLTRARQTFRRERAGLLAVLLVLSVIVLLLPAVFDAVLRVHDTPELVAISDEKLSLVVAAVMLTLYGANLAYTLVTHRDVFAGESGHAEAPAWSVTTCLAVLAAATAGAALESELISDAIEGAAEALGLPALFLGVIVLALVGTAADLVAAVWFAHRDRMGMVMGICIGSSIQVALVVAPLLVVLSWLLGHPMSLVFENKLHLFAIAGTALIVNAIAADGETTWFEGLLLIGVYVVLATAYFFV
jgi:Ca2+:H+ antiporter